MKPLLIAAAAMIALPAMPALAQDAMASAALPKCSAKVKDGCMQTSAQEARAMSGAQADKRDSKSGMWTPNGGGSDKDAMAKPMKMHHKMHKKAAMAAKPMADKPMTPEAAPK